MPVQTDAPIGTGTNTDWGLWGSAGSKVSALAADDGDTSIVYASSGGRLVKDDYTFPPIAGVADPVTSASISAVTRLYLIGAGGRAYYIRWNGSRSGANRQAEVKVKRPNYLTVTYASTDLALASVNGQHGMEFSAAGGPSQKAEYWVTQLYRTVDFDYSAGSADGFAHNIGAIAALIGGSLLFRSMPALSAYLAEKTGLFIRPDEYRAALGAWNARKRLVLV